MQRLVHALRWNQDTWTHIRIVLPRLGRGYGTLMPQLEGNTHRAIEPEAPRVRRPSPYGRRSLLPSGGDSSAGASIVNIVLFGATGLTGRLVAERAILAGYDVTAYARDPARMNLAHDRLRVLRGDVLDAASVDRAVAGHDAVVSALGTSTRGPAPVLSHGVRHILDAMERHRVRRIVVLSAAGALHEPAGFAVGNVGLGLFRMLLPGVYQEHAKMLGEVRRRDLDWTAVRAVLLTNGPPKGRYRVALEAIPRWGFRISRADVADFMIRQLTSDEFVCKMPAISY
jgi:putative NADH-flavin reductase